MDFDHYLAYFEACGGTDVPYLRLHFPRFLATRQRFLSQRNNEARGAFLDVGAHWLHQSLLYALDGFAVTAVDVPTTFDDMHVRALAERHGIRLLSEPEHERAHALRALPENSVDVVLFTEIIEHITFNPVAMWREIYRVMKPGGRIVVTTPNFYGLRRLLRATGRFVRGEGGSVAVDSILHQPSFAHHWKEYSLRELRHYFCTLSSDFVPGHTAYVTKYEASAVHPAIDTILRCIESLFPSLRPNLYVEIVLLQKTQEIAIDPQW